MYFCFYVVGVKLRGKDMGSPLNPPGSKKK